MKPRLAELAFSKTDVKLLTSFYKKQVESKESIDTTELKLTDSTQLSLVKNTISTLAQFNETASVENNKERWEKFMQHAAPMRATADHISTIAQLTGSDDLRKVGIGLESLSQIGLSLPVLMTEMKAGSVLGMAHPLAAVVAGILVLGNLLSGKSGGKYQENMVNYLVCIREEMHAGFSLIDKNIGIVYVTVRQGIIHLDKLTRQQTEYLDHSITLSTNRIENTVFDRADVILRGLQDVHLADLEKIITDIALMLNDPKKYDLKEKQKMIDFLFHWLVKGIRQPLQNGLNEFKSLQRNQIDVYKKINALITCNAPH